MYEPTNDAQPPREIPLPPGGGSWRFDEARWAWAPNDGTVPQEQPAAADPAAAPTEAQAAEQPTIEE
jgi:hypothetical protein